MDRSEIAGMYGEYTIMDTGFLRQRDAQFEAIFQDRRLATENSYSTLQRTTTIQSVAVVTAIGIATASELEHMNPVLGTIGMTGALVSWVKAAAEMTHTQALSNLTERVSQLYHDIARYFDETDALQQATGYSLKPKKAVTPGDTDALDALAVERFLEHAAIDNAFSEGHISSVERKNLQWKAHSNYSMLALNQEDLLYFSKAFTKLSNAKPVLDAQEPLVQRLFRESHSAHQADGESSMDFRP